MPEADTPGPRRSLADQLQDRLVNFAVEVLALTGRLPNTLAARHIAGQIIRSATSPAPNYGEARAAESRDDFIHKLGIVHKELNETFVWLLVIDRSGMIPTLQMNGVIDECDQLCRIVGSSRSTARMNRGDDTQGRWRS